MGEIDAIQVTVNDVIYNLWSTKEPNSLTRMMVTGDRLLAYDKCNDIVRIWKKNGEDLVIGIFVTAMQLATTTTSDIHFHQL